MLTNVKKLGFVVDFTTLQQAENMSNREQAVVELKFNLIQTSVT